MTICSSLKHGIWMISFVGLFDMFRATPGNAKTVLAR
jgi:hypothetical protein